MNIFEDMKSLDVILTTSRKWQISDQVTKKLIHRNFSKWNNTKNCAILRNQPKKD